MWRYLIPNGITSTSLILGLVSVRVAVGGDLELAAWMVVWGVLLDTLDGAAARLLHASSELGAQLDSFADFVIFGLAPAALISAAVGPWGEVAGAVFVLATAVRLARYNIAAADVVFRGVPTTTCGATVALLWLVLGEEGAALYPWLLLALSVAMHAPVRIARLRPQAGHPLRNAAMGVCVVMACTLGPLRLYPAVLLGMVVFAIAGGLLWAPRAE
jgi:CDP-diacylglycerol--serine O-phosphatidyltransferase